MVLRAAGLVVATRHGRQRHYRIEPDALANALLPWLERYAAYWASALERLRSLAEGGPPTT
jgi:hypothetical protein